VDPIVPKLLELFNAKLHHFTPNTIVQMSKFIWAVRTFGGEVSVGAFCRLYELHCQEYLWILYKTCFAALPACIATAPARDREGLQWGQRGKVNVMLTKSVRQT